MELEGGNNNRQIFACQLVGGEFDESFAQADYRSNPDRNETAGPHVHVGEPEVGGEHMIDGEVSKVVDGVDAAVGGGEGNDAKTRGERRLAKKLAVHSFFGGFETDGDREGTGSERMVVKKPGPAVEQVLEVDGSLEAR